MKTGLAEIQGQKKKGENKTSFLKKLKKNLYNMSESFLKIMIIITKSRLSTILSPKTRKNKRGGNQGDYFDDYINDIQYEY